MASRKYLKRMAAFVALGMAPDPTPWGEMREKIAKHRYSGDKRGVAARFDELVAQFAKDGVPPGQMKTMPVLTGDGVTAPTSKKPQIKRHAKAPPAAVQKEVAELKTAEAPATVAETPSPDALKAALKAQRVAMNGAKP